MTDDQQPDSTEQDQAAPRRPVKPGSPVFSGPAAPTHAVRANGRPVTQVFGRTDQPQPQQPAADVPLGADPASDGH